MQRIKFINARGAEVVFDKTAPYIFWKAEGLSQPAASPVATAAAGQHGYTLHNILLDRRVVRLTGHIHGKSGVQGNIHELYKKRRELISVCNPLFGQGTLIYENDGGSWSIPAFVSETPYADKLREVQTLSVVFECPMPFWLASEQIVSLAYVYGGMQFPVKTPSSFGTLGYRAIIDNDSDALVPLEFLLDGGSLNPVIINQTTGEYIKFDKQIMPGDRLYINTGSMEVSLITTDPVTNQPVRQPAYGYVTHDSALFSLVQGENILTFESDDENRKVKIRISFKKRYVGV